MSAESYGYGNKFRKGINPQHIGWTEFEYGGQQYGGWADTQYTGPRNFKQVTPVGPTDPGLRGMGLSGITGKKHFGKAKKAFPAPIPGGGRATGYHFPERQRDYDIPLRSISNEHQTHPTCLLYTSPSPRDS